MTSLWSFDKVDLFLYPTVLAASPRLIDLPDEDDGDDDDDDDKDDHADERPARNSCFPQIHCGLPDNDDDNLTIIASSTRYIVAYLMMKNMTSP